ncbi:Cysteine-rich membrane protein 2 [Spironucleus salmonicida]|uniref:Cysteine-rich membrane protein 2 n=1 Tax=Spironucleus salmonicida TaxID=348837 RepID=V6LD73_9EUKA|nr:Cysteine-rich membrane protein 2 [Spironucleus salmonicida]|eukprot:EST42427.1 Cysteine-rich membrane protein 2 [Spironucleus salmonicida]
MNTDQTCTEQCKGFIEVLQACVNNIIIPCGSYKQQTSCRCGPVAQNCLTCQATAVPEGGTCTDARCTCGKDSPDTCTGCIDLTNYRFANEKCIGLGTNKCLTCLPGYIFKDDNCTDCAVAAEKVGDFCVIPRKEAGNLSGGAVSGIMIAVLIVVGTVGGGLAYYFIKRANK